MKKSFYKNPYRAALRQRIESLNVQVFKRSDLVEHNINKEQLRLNRALKALSNEGVIIKIAHGLYAKAENMLFPDGKTRTVLRKPFESVVVEALNKLGVKWELGSAIQEYNRGETTQIPVKFIIRLKSRYRGTINAEGRSVIFEGDINAR